MLPHGLDSEYNWGLDCDGEYIYFGRGFLICSNVSSDEEVGRLGLGANVLDRTHGGVDPLSSCSDCIGASTPLPSQATSLIISSTTSRFGSALRGRGISTVSLSMGSMPLGAEGSAGC